MLLAVIVSAISAGSSALNANTRSRSVVEQTNENYILSLAEQAAVALDSLPKNFEYSKLLSGVEMKGVKSSYAYLVAKDGTMLYHPTESKIGQPVENSVVKGVVQELAAGKTPQG